MKKNLFLIVCCCFFALTSCHKNGVNLFVGYYSFKTSGEVSIMAEAGIEGNNITIPASLNVSLSNDIGQLDISVSDKKHDEVIVVINYLNGDVITTTGTCDGKNIYLDEFQRDILPVSISTLFTNYSVITVSGTGQMYDEDMIVFDMTIKGKATIGSVTYKIRDKDLKMVAYRN